VDLRLIRCTLVEVETFQIAVPDEVLADLATRLQRTRRPPGQTGPDGPAGGPPHEDAATLARIEELIGRWRDGYDWRALERRINAVPQYRVTVDGVGLHVLQAPGAGPDPLPLLLLNGWPSSIVEYLEVLPRLTDPAAYGGDPADSFTVVVPAMPGYGFSDRCLDRQPTRRQIAGLFDRLMTGSLGHDRYVAHGDDIGAGVVNRLGLLAPPAVLALSTANPIRPHLDSALTAGEQSYADGAARWEADHGAYAHVQATRPRTLAAALHDSPAGLAAWILEKWLTWSDPATRHRLTDDHLLGTVTLYWVTETMGSSIRLYTPATAAPLEAGQRITVPTSVLMPHEPDLPVPPESWLRRAYADLRRHVELDEGGHFLAAESPDRFATELRETFRPYRNRTGHGAMPGR
jgi:pimeloyl-ACP methyl ester carboxylesterase